MVHDRSDSVVVKPTPEKAERAWECATSRDRPVNIRAMAAILVNQKRQERTVKREKIATILCKTSARLVQQDRGPCRHAHVVEAVIGIQERPNNGRVIQWKTLNFFRTFVEVLACIPGLPDTVAQ